MSKSEDVQFLSPEEFARRTGLAAHTVRSMVREHRLAATKTSPGKGGRVLILASEIERLRNEAEMWRYVPPPDSDVKDPDPR